MKATNKKLTNQVYLVLNNSMIKLLKIKDYGDKVIITRPVEKKMSLPSLHDTFHARNPSEGFNEDIVHLREHRTGTSSTDTVLREVIPSGDLRLINSTWLDISDVDWGRSVDKHEVNDRTLHLNYNDFDNHLTIYIYVDKTGKGEEIILNDLKSGKLPIWTLYKDGVRTIPPTDNFAYAIGSFTRTVQNDRLVVALINSKSYPLSAWDGIGRDEFNGGIAAYAPGKKYVR